MGGWHGEWHDHIRVVGYGLWFGAAGNGPRLCSPAQQLGQHWLCLYEPGHVAEDLVWGVDEGQEGWLIPEAVQALTPLVTVGWEGRGEEEGGQRR